MGGTSRYAPLMTAWTLAKLLNSSAAADTKKRQDSKFRATMFSQQPKPD
jgi:hypothetical protein